MVRLLEKETEKETQTCRQKDYRSTVVEDREHERQTEESNQADGNGDAEMDDGMSC